MDERDAWGVLWPRVTEALVEAQRLGQEATGFARGAQWALMRLNPLVTVPAPHVSAGPATAEVAPDDETEDDVTSKKAWRKRARRAEHDLALAQSAVELWRGEAGEAHQLMLEHASDAAVRVAELQAELDGLREKATADAGSWAQWITATSAGHDALARDRDAWRLVAVTLAGGEAAAAQLRDDYASGDTDAGAGDV